MEAASVIFFGWCLVLAAAGSCREAGLCCDGRDGRCVVYYHRQDTTAAPGLCYCDHACLTVGDCCPDFQEVCEVSDCEVSAWASWSACSSQCGTGAMRRERSVVRPARSGGQPCPELVQKRSCYRNQCEGKVHAKADREVAMILPATYAPLRHLNATQDIRSNLRLRYQKDPAEESVSEYCVAFEITQVHRACESLKLEPDSLSVGARVRAVCEPAAMRRHLGYRCQGQGTERKSTPFTLLAFPQCRGRWRRLEVTDCQQDGTPNFIFV